MIQMLLEKTIYFEIHSFLKVGKNKTGSWALLPQLLSVS